MRKEALPKGLKAPRTDVPKRAKREETRRLKRDLRFFKDGEKKPCLQERDKCPALAQIRDAANKAQRGTEMTNPFASSSPRALGGEGPGL